LARIIDAPLGLPSDTPLRTLRDERMIADVDALIRSFAPHARWHGAVRPGDAQHLPSDEALLICSPDWPLLAERFDAVLGPNRVYVLLEPEDYAWGHADFARSLPRWPERHAKGQVSQLEGRAHFSKWAKLVMNDDGSLGKVDPDTLWLFQSRAAQHRVALAEVRARLADAESVRTLDALMTGTVSDLFQRYAERVFRHVQYLECGALFPGMVIVDGGIQEGFELPYDMAHTGGTAEVVCVDPSGFERLGPFVAATVRHFSKQFRVVPRALWSSTGDVALPVLDGIVLSQFKGHREVSFPEVVMPCETIDSIVEREKLGAVDLIKLDVEGAEPEVLRGMRETIEKHRPQLAISVYHWPEHMWELPLELMRSLTDYDFHLRHYSFGRWECVLYAVPKPGTAPRLDRYRQAA
jgi:FkbM family methyltransferase